MEREGSSRFPIPPKHLSITEHVNDDWRAAIECLKRGQPHAGKVKEIERYLAGRKTDFEAGILRAEYHWETDLNVALSMHLYFQDEAERWQVRRDKLEAFWSEHAKEQQGYINAVAVEGLKAIIIIHGALALASLAVLTGQVASPHGSVLFAAQVGLLAAVLGMGMAAVGQILLFHFQGESIGRIQSVMGAPHSLRRLYALGRHFRRFIRPKLILVNGLIYGSVGVFILGAVTAAIILLSTDV